MKNLFYILAVISIGVAAFFGWQVKDKHSTYVDRRDKLISQNKIQTGKIAEQEEKREVAARQKAEARDKKNEAIAKLEQAKGKMGELKRALSGADSRLEEANGRIAKVNAFIKELEEEVESDDVRVEDVPELVTNLRDEKKNKDKQLEELEIIFERLDKEVTKVKADIERTRGKITESKGRVGANDFEASIASVNNDWGFLIIGAGSNAGLTGESKLLVKRGNRLVGKVAISSLEPNLAVAEVVRGSLADGAVIQAGDRVILENVNAN